MSVKPIKSRISTIPLTNGKSWAIPAKKGVGFLMIFGLFFGGIPLLILSFTLYTMLFGNSDAESISLLGFAGISLFLGIFILVGGAVFFLGLKIRYTSYLVTCQEGAVEVVKKFFRKEVREKIERSNVHSVGLYSNSQTNGKPDYGLLLKGKSGAEIKFCNEYKEDELRWLASDMLKALSQQGALPTEEELLGNYFNSQEHESTGVFKTKAVNIAPLDGSTQGNFVIVKKGSAIGKSMLLGGLFGILFSGIFIWIGFKVNDAPFIFGIAGSIIALVSLIVFLTGLFNLGTSEKFTFKSDRIIKEKIRGRVSKNKSVIQKSSVKKLEIASSGSSNNQTRYSVTLTGKAGEKILKLFSWVDQDVSDVVKYKVNAWLKPEKKADSATASFSSGYGSSIPTDPSQKDIELNTTVAPNEVPIYQSSVKIKNVKGGIWMVRLFLTLFLAIGLGLTIFGVFNILNAKQSESWPSTNGVILTSKITVNNSSDGTTYGTDVSYRYQLEGIKYKGDKVTISEVSTSSRSRAQKIIKSYPIGSKHSVFYDPNNPTESVLEPGITGGSWLMPGVGLVFLIIPLFILIASEKAHRKDSYRNKLGQNS